MTLEIFPRAVADSIVTGAWTLLPDTARHWTESQPSEPLARLSLIIGLLLNWNYAEAYEHHNALISELACSAENTKRVIQTVELFVGKYPTEAGPRLFYGLMLAQMGELESALREYKEGAKLAPEDPYPHYYQGQAYQASDRLDLAIREYREAVRLAPHEPHMRLNLGSAYQHQGNLESAIPQFREAVKLNPSDPVAHYNLGVALVDQGRLEMAIGAYKESARLNPKDPMVHYQLGVAQEKRGRLGEAIAEYQAATELAPSFALGYRSLGWVYYNQNKAGLAAEAFGKAVQYNEKDSHSLHGLGLTKLALGAKEDAIRYLQQAYRLEDREDKRHLIHGTLVRLRALPY